MPKEGANSEDLFGVAVTTGELIVGREKFTQFARCFYDKIGQFSINLLVPRLEEAVLDFLSARNFWKKFFAGTNFRELMFDHKNHENFCLTKISHYTVYSPAPSHPI